MIRRGFLKSIAGSVAALPMFSWLPAREPVRKLGVPFADEEHNRVLLYAKATEYIPEKRLVVVDKQWNARLAQNGDDLMGVGVSTSSSRTGGLVQVWFTGIWPVGVRAASED